MTHFKLVYPNFSDQIYPSLTLTSIASWINYRRNSNNNYRHTVEIVDLSFHRKNWEAFLHEKIFDNDIIGLTVTTLTLAENILMIEWLRKNFKSLYIILGGIGVTIDPHYIFNQYGELIDGLCIGDAENTIDEVLEHFDTDKNFNKIAGFWSIDHNREELIITSLRDFIEDLDTVPFLDYNLWDPRHFEHIFQIPIHASRSCLYNCTFCSQSALKKRVGPSYYRHRSPKIICDEIQFQLESLKNSHKGKGFSGIVFFDDTFTSDKLFITNFCKEMINRQLNKRVRWECNARFENLSQELIKKMKNAGCYFINLGIENANEIIRKSYGKSFTNLHIENIMECLRSNNIFTKLFFIIGGPTDSKETIKASIQYPKKLHADFYNFTPFFAIYGTTLFEKIAVKEEKMEEKYVKVFDLNNFSKTDRLDRIMSSVVLGHEVSVLKSIPLIVESLISSNYLTRIKARSYIGGLIRYFFSLLKLLWHGSISDIFSLIPKIVFYKFGIGDIVHDTLKKYVLIEGWRRHPNPKN